MEDMSNSLAPSSLKLTKYPNYLKEVLREGFSGSRKWDFSEVDKNIFIYLYIGIFLNFPFFVIIVSRQS